MSFAKTLEEVAKCSIDGQEGVVFCSDDILPTCNDMQKFVSLNIDEIFSYLRRGVFVQIGFSSPLTEGFSNKAILNNTKRSRLSRMNVWHQHQHAALFVPKQEEPVIPTMISSLNIVCTAARKTMQDLGLRHPLEQGQCDEHMRTFLLHQNRLINSNEVFSSTEYFDSGFAILIPEGVIHARSVVEADYEGSGGVSNNVIL